MGSLLDEDVIRFRTMGPLHLPCRLSRACPA
jgi:hypothetical protein